MEFNQTTLKNDNDNGKLPQHFKNFVEIFFAVVLGASILEFHKFLFPPDFTDPSFWALIIVYITTFTSWIGWHRSTTLYHYTDSVAGHLRSALDGLIVLTYAALLFFGSRVENIFTSGNSIDNALSLYLWGFVVVFFLYFIVGEVRRAEYHDPRASEISKIVYHGSFMLIVAITYTIISTLYENIVVQHPTII